MFVGKLSDDSCGEIKRARRNGVNKGKKEKEVSVGESLEKGRIFNHERRGVYARGFSRELATFVARVVYTRGCRVSCFIGHLRRVRPTLCRRARGTRAGKSYDCREAREEVGGGGGGGY